ncbi:MAG: SpoIVB peptidase [Oscillospiraceae bacterium]|nr:SpoIVB peptidase [Oscillospiraceae bacterium]
MKKLIKKFTFFLTLSVFTLFGTLTYYSYHLPDSYYCDSDSGMNITFGKILKITARPENLSGTAPVDKISSGTTKAQLMLMNVIPIKSVEVQNIDVPMLSPCGKPFGIKLIMDGVMVIKTGDVVCNGKNISPAKNAGIKKGDIIKSVNGTEITSNNELEKAVSDLSSRKIQIVLIRDGKEICTEISPVYSDSDGKYKLGIWVRDSSAGIGTVTYLDTLTNTFGGLGHPVCDSDTGQIIPLSSGEVMEVNICGVKKGICGTPGELQGSFSGPESCGMLMINNKYGVFGTISPDFSASEPIPMALKQDIKTGKAHIYSTLSGDEPEVYEIEIEEIDYNTDNTSKNMVIKITDKELLKKSGGIVQGMSGSPIIQNGKLVGAVTHVFVDDPSRGYGIFCENMYEISQGL